MIHHHTITPEEIREHWNKMQATGELSVNQRALAHYRDRWIGTYVDPWVGVSGAQMQDRLDNGYYPEDQEIPDMSGGSQAIHVPQFDWNEEEGEFQYEAMLNGDDAYYVQFEDKDSPKGMTISFRVDFNCGTSAETIAAFMDWVLSVIERAESIGIAPDVELFHSGRGMWSDDERRIDHIHVPLIKAGELNDVVSWRAHISGGAFRSLGFLSYGIIGDRIGKKCRDNLGWAVGPRDWEILWDGETLKIEGPETARDFPTDKLNKRLEEIFSTF